MPDVRAWVAAKAGRKGKAYIVVVHGKDGSATVTDHPSKKDAHAYATTQRNAGKDAYAHSKEDAKKYGLDPRERDAQGRFA